MYFNNNLKSEFSAILFILFKIKKIKKSCITLKLIEILSNLGKSTSQMPFFGELDIYGMNNRLIKYLWILKLMIKHMPFPNLNFVNYRSKTLI